jgi:hypothetical protein
MENLISNQEQRDKIQKFIQTELLKRGFKASIIEFKEEQGRSGNRFTFTTSGFQTTPVIFESIVVDNFSSSIGSLEEHPESKVEFRNFWIQVHVSYKHFGGGSNGCSLFDVVGVLCSDKVYGLAIR